MRTNSILQEMIYRRKSTRAYTKVPADAETIAKITEQLATIEPLYPEIKTRFEIVGRDKVRSMFRWFPEQAVAAFSEEREGYLENIGYILARLDLYLHSIGLGTCWIGMGRMSDASVMDMGEDKFVILLAFGYPESGTPYRERDEFNRKPLDEISDYPDTRLEPVRLAPSSINSQPWYITHGEGGALHIYRTADNLLRAKVMARFNTIDMGIAIAHLAVSLGESFRFERLSSPPSEKGRVYLGTVYTDLQDN